MSLPRFKNIEKVYIHACEGITVVNARRTSNKMRHLWYHISLYIYRLLTTFLLWCYSVFTVKMNSYIIYLHQSRKIAFIALATVSIFNLALIWKPETSKTVWRFQTNFSNILIIFYLRLKVFLQFYIFIHFHSKAPQKINQQSPKNDMKKLLSKIKLFVTFLNLFLWVLLFVNFSVTLIIWVSFRLDANS